MVEDTLDGAGCELGAQRTYNLVSGLLDFAVGVVTVSLKLFVFRRILENVHMGSIPDNFASLNTRLRFGALRPNLLWG
jgi:hypothetical protein